jgi:hypothetical protein
MRKKELVRWRKRNKIDDETDGNDREISSSPHTFILSLSGSVIGNGNGSYR